MKEFTGFANDIKPFFEELRKNNNKEWFDLNRKRYEKVVKDEAKNLVESIDKEFKNQNLPFHANPKVSLFRINRDIRFSANKEPYKTNLGIFFPHSYHEVTTKENFAGLYFHLDADESFIAGGIHMPDPNSLKSIRNKIANSYEELFAIVNDSEFKNHYSASNRMEAPPLKKVPRGFSEDHPAADLLKLKDFSYFCNLDYKDVFDKNLIDILIVKAKVIKPFLDFFSDSIVTNIPLI